MSRRRGVKFSYVLLATEVVSSLLFTPYLIRSLGQVEFGLYSLVASITAYFLLLDAGVGNALVRYVAKYRVTDDLMQQRRFIGVSLAFYGFIGLAVVLLGSLLRNNLALIFGGGLTPSEISHAGRLLQVTLSNAAMTLLFSVFDRTIIAYERFALLKLLAMARLLARVVVSAVLLFLGYRSLAVVSVNLAVTVIAGFAAGWFVVFRLGIKPSLRGVSASFVREIFGYSGLIFLQMVATQINAMADQVILGIMTTSAIVGIYAVGAQLSNYYQSIAGGVNGVLMPGVVRMIETNASKDAVLHEMVKVGRLVFAVLGVVLAGFLVMGRRFVVLWVGAANEQAYWVALILMAASIMYLTQSVGTQVLWAMGRHRVQAYLNVGIAVANISLTVLLVKWNPLLGAAIGTAVAVIIGNVVVLNVVFAKDIGVSIRSYYLGLLRGVLPSLIIAGMAGWLVGMGGLQGWSGLLAQGLAVLVAYGSSMFAFGMNDYERRLVGSLGER